MESGVKVTFMGNYFDKIKNSIDFYLRQKILFSRIDYFEQNELKNSLFSSQDEIDREKYLYEKYDLSKVKSSTTCKNYLENLYLLDILDLFLNIDFQDNLNILDVGSSTWSYVKSQYQFFKKNSTSLCLNGIELDANRLNTRFYSRKEVAKFHIKNLENTNYTEGDFLEHKERYDYIIWILPFILEYPLFRWGLPIKYFRPEEMLKHAHCLLKDGGQMIIINQGEEEYKTQKLLYDKLGIGFKDFGLIKSTFQLYKKERYLTLVQK